MTALALAQRMMIVIALFYPLACSAPASAPPATQAVVPTATVAVDAPSPATPTPASVPPAALPFSLQLPSGWITATVDAHSASGLVASANAPAWLAKRADDLPADGATSTILLGWPGDEANQSGSELGLMALAVPAENLRLPTVVSATAASLARTPEVTMTSATLLPGLRPGGEPVGQIDYLLHTTAGPLSGKQFIIHDIGARQLVILTFSGSAEKMEQFAIQFAAQVVESVRSVSTHNAP